MSAVAQLRTLSALLFWRPEMELAVTLIDLLQSASSWNDDDATIYVARPWSCEADAIVVRTAPDTTVPVQRGVASYIYFMEISIAREFIEDYALSVEGASSNMRERCERLIRYAEDDA